MKHIWDTDTYCEYDLTPATRKILKGLGNKNSEGCAAFFVQLDFSGNIEKELEYFSFKSQISLEEQKTLQNEYYRYDSIALNSFTSDFWHNTLEPSILDYFTSSILHADIAHLVFKLIFFFAFAIALEQILGSILFLGFCALCCITTALSYEYGIFGVQGGVLPTLGLSGVISGIMAFTAILYPYAKTSVFYWVIFVIGKV